MKLSFYCILILYLISGQINAARRNESIQSHKGIEHILNTVFGQVSSLYKQIQLIIMQLSNTAEAGIRKIEEDFIKVAINISDLVNDYGDSAKDCIKKFWRKIELAKTQLKSNIEECAKHVKSQGNQITDNLQKQQKIIENSSKLFFETINECLEFSSGKIAECIFLKVGELKNIANDVTISTEQTLKEAVAGTSRISKDGNNCIRKSIEKFGRIQKEVSTRIRNCVKNSWSDYF